MNKLLSLLVLFGLCGIFSGMLFAGELEIYPTAKEMPTDLQGPFVSIDRGILCVEKNQVHQSFDGGLTWESKQILDPEKYLDRDERALIRTREGTIIFVFMNDKELQRGTNGWGKGNVEDWVLPVYVTRSVDQGETWSAPVSLQRTWCGAVRSIIQLASGRIVLITSTVIPWENAVVIYVSDDQGQTWQKTGLVTIEGHHDHDGAMEATIIERNDHSIYMLIRTTKGTFFESTSIDSGMTWSEPTSSGIQSSTCCGMMTRLADGRISLLWNRVQCNNPYDYAPDGTVHTSREELSVAFSSDDARTWSEPLVIAARYKKESDQHWEQSQVAYPYLYEVEAGKFWITSMYGGLRISVDEQSLLNAITTLEKEKPNRIQVKNIVLFGDSTTAVRTNVTTYGEQLQERFKQERLNGLVINSGVSGSTTTDARENFERLVKLKNPDLLIIQFGINDSAIDVWATPPAKDARISKAVFEDNLNWFIQQAKIMNIPVILMTTTQLRWSEKTKELYGKAPYDANDPNSFNEVSLRGYNDIIRKVAASAKVPLVDIFALWDEIATTQGEEEIMSLLLEDAMHPGTKGHSLTAEHLYPVLRDAIELEEYRKSTIIPLKILHD